MPRPADIAGTVFSVSELNNAVRDLLEHSFGLLWVEGEISNLARPRSGHVYFSLKDGGAQVRCALFAGKARLVRASLDNGVLVRVRARVSVYAARGDYQLIVEHVEDAGHGALQRAYEALKARLDAEGLFAVDRKQALPAMPTRIGVITSATGAAVRDVLSVVSRRFPLGAVRIYPVPVQGDAAPKAIVAALEAANRRADCDVLLLVRGGGSLEDLWAFNDEAVARAIVASRLPVVSGVGHEVDTTIADFAADVRAATPSAAAELVCPDLGARAAALPVALTRLRSHMAARIAAANRQAESLTQRLARQHPRRWLETSAQRLDDIDVRLQRSIARHLADRRRTATQLAQRVMRCSPRLLMARHNERIQRLTHRLDQSATAAVTRADQRLKSAMRALHSVSPLQTLERGYAIARDGQGQVVRTSETVTIGDRLTVNLARGQLDCQVREVSRARDGIPLSDSHDSDADSR